MEHFLELAGTAPIDGFEEQPVPKQAVHGPPGCAKQVSGGYHASLVRLGYHASLICLANMPV